MGAVLCLALLSPLVAAVLAAARPETAAAEELALLALGGAIARLAAIARRYSRPSSAAWPSAIVKRRS